MMEAGGALSVHPAAKIFPLLEGRPLQELAEDILSNGLRQPIVLLDGAVLDGRNRLAACEMANVEPHFEAYGEYDQIESFDSLHGRDVWRPHAIIDIGDDCEPLIAPYCGLLPDPVAFVVSTNLHRRHLTESQRAMVAARIANLEPGRPSENAQTCAVSQPTAAELLNVSRRAVQAAAAVQREAIPALAAAVDSGAVAVSTAADVARLPQAEQVEIVAKGEREILEAAKRIRADRADKSRDLRLAKIEQISAGNNPLDTTRKYPIIYADPPWRYELPAMGGTNRSIENHYPTMTLEEICALPVVEIAADDALLYLWATAPKLPECLKVIEAWGFEYRTHIVWVKDKIGMGYHARNQHELLLIAKRGEIPPPRPGEQPSSVIEAPRGAHSEKPALFAELIEQLYPDIGRIELFCRSPRAGWDAWGNQAGSDRAAA